MSVPVEAIELRIRKRPDGKEDVTVLAQVDGEWRRALKQIGGGVFEVTAWAGTTAIRDGVRCDSEDGA